mgnify:FL=1
MRTPSLLTHSLSWLENALQPRLQDSRDNMRGPWAG